MGESHSLFRIAIFIGFVLLMSSVLTQPWVYVGQTLPSNSPWGQFSSGIQNFPRFSNPYDVLTSGALLTADNRSALTSSWTTVGTAHRCSNAAYWNCINDPGNVGNLGNNSDLNRTYVTNIVFLDPTGPGPFFEFNSTTTYPFVGLGLVSLSVSLLCRTVGTGGYGKGIDILVEHPSYPFGFIAATFNPFDINSTGGGAVCPYGQDFKEVDIGILGGNQTLTDDRLRISIVTMNRDSSISIDLSTVAIAAVFSTQNQVSCPGGDFVHDILAIGCQIIKVFQYVVNGIIFVFSVIAWFVGMIGIFFGALASVLAVPGAPPIVSGLIGILIIGSLFFVAIVFMGKIRGTGNTG